MNDISVQWIISVKKKYLKPFTYFKQLILNRIISLKYQRLKSFYCMQINEFWLV